MTIYYDPRTNQYLKSSDPVEHFTDANRTVDETTYNELVASNLNPANPPDIGYATTYALDDSRPSTVQVYSSDANLQWPSTGGYDNTDKSGIGGVDCLWSWDAKCLPKSSNYIADTSTANARGSQLHKDQSLNEGAQGLIPNSDGLAKCHEPPQAPFVFTSGGKTYVYEDPGYLRQVSDSDGSASKDWSQTKLSDGTKINDARTNSGLTPLLTDKPPVIPGTGTGGTFVMAGEVPAYQMVKNLKTLSTQAKYWADMGRKNAMLYNTKTAVAASKYGEIEKTNSLLRKQAGNTTGNDSKVNRINSSISSQQRQVQIANDATRRRNENIFLLKLLLVYFLVVMIPLIAKRMFGTNFKVGHAILVIVFVSCPFLYILLWNLWAIRNRSAIRWPLRNWPAGQLPPDNDKYQEEAPVCHPLPECPECAEECDEIEAEIDADERAIARCKTTINSAKSDKKGLRQELCACKKRSQSRGGPPANCLGGTVTF